MMKKLRDPGKPYIIAEVGINHNGSGTLAKLLCELSIKAGASAVKFQLFDVDELVSETASMAEYQKNNSETEETQHQMLSRNVISFDVLKECRKICSQNDVDFICTAFDYPSLIKILELEPELIKWPSGEIDNIPLLRTACLSGLPLLLSTGMADETEIDDAIQACIDSGLNLSDVIILHCTSQYPTPLKLSNINSVRFLKDRFGTTVGFSDHTMGSRAAQLALANGAIVFEKHVTLSRLMDGVDHPASATIEEFENYVKDLNDAVQILGKAEKKCFPVESSTKTIARKSLVAKSDIKRGEPFNHSNVGSKRPGHGISPKNYEVFLNKKARRSIAKGEILSWGDMED